ncbi:hypothetical protein DXG03_008039 [Asterophora parasitica]|uniref:Uncharacterized protein n=1 Tax=Asterophora parasitica TaxID=117018 RepID=A0A9P7G5Y4_9AGAR|nr:hypothetical protein DXG03_008039 [Asterophora parasitica]
MVMSDTKTPKHRATGLQRKHTPSLGRCDVQTYPQTPSLSANSHFCSDSDDSDDAPTLTPSYTTTVRLRATIAAVPETRLREIMVRLVDRSPGFQHAVAKELLAVGTAFDSASASPRRKRRRSGRRSLDTPILERPCVNCGKHVKVDGAGEKEICVHHPGRLEEQVYEFPSRTPEGHAFQVRRRITMWSCCDEDARSLGCASVSAHVRAGEGRARAASHATVLGAGSGTESSRASAH